MTTGNAAAVTLLPACVAKVGAGGSWATFGYESSASRPVILPVGSSNKFVPSPVDRGQPTRFDPGKHARAFNVPFDGKSLTWSVGARQVAVNAASPPCGPSGSTTAPLLAQFVLYAEKEITLNGSSLVGGDVGVLGAGAPPRDGEVELKSSAAVDLTRNVFGRTVEVDHGASAGAVFTTHLQNHGGHVGLVAAFPSQMPPLPAVVPAKPGTTAITVKRYKTLTLAPGKYGDVKVEGTLTLNGGTFEIASLDVQADGRVEASAGVRLRVKGTVHLGCSARLRTNPVGLARDLLVEVAASGDKPAVLAERDAEIHAVLAAPFGRLLFQGARARGAFAAREIQLEPRATIVFEGGFPLPLKDCLSRLQLGADEFTPGEDPQTLARTIASTACLAPDVSACEVTLIALANFDRRTAAKQLVGGVLTPARYISISRDRARKLRLAELDPTWASAFCRGDADGDLVPDDRDSCPGTPPLTATDDHGCTDPTLPRAPDPEKMKRVFENVGLMISAQCDGVPEPQPPIVTDVCLDRPNVRFLVTVTKDTTQPSRCLVWYQMITDVVERFEPREHFRALLSFERGQAVAETATTLTLPLPLTCASGNEMPADGRSWSCDETNGDPFHSLFAARAVNGLGLRSQWGQARQFPFHLCQ